MIPQLNEALINYPSDVACYDVQSRRHKAEKIRRILQDYRRTKRIDGTLGNCLDVGCGPGIITDGLANEFEMIVGLDLNRRAICYGHQLKDSRNLAFLVGNVQRLPLPDDVFDTVICAQVYEHVPDPFSLVSEIWRVLKPGGICFFSGPNRLALMEEHYFLPLLSWLPRPMANAYVRLTGRGCFYDAHPWFLWQIAWLWRRFDRYDYTLELIRRPKHFMMNHSLEKWSWLANLPPPLVNILMIFVPNYNWVLTKPSIELEQ